MSNNIKWNWQDSQKVHIHDISPGLRFGGNARYTKKPFPVKKFDDPVTTYERNMTNRYFKYPELRDRKWWTDKGYIWDRDNEEWIKLNSLVKGRKYKFDSYGNLQFTDVYDPWQDYLSG